MTKTASFRIEIPEDDWVSKFFLLADIYDYLDKTVKRIHNN